MRDILFRGQQKGDRKWVEGSLVVWPDGDCEILTADWVPYELSKIDVHPETVGQYTGLTDCRNAKLFEHDVVTAKFKTNGARYNFKIIFRDGCFLFDNGCVAVRFDEIRSAMKIGNIHDTPELLKGGAKDG